MYGNFLAEDFMANAALAKVSRDIGMNMHRSIFSSVESTLESGDEDGGEIEVIVDERGTWATFFITFLLYGAILVLALISLYPMMNRFTLMYNPRGEGYGSSEEEKQRRSIPSIRSSLAAVNRKLFPSFEDEEQCVRECGVDSLVFLRMLRMGFVLSCVACFNAMVLIPVYATAPLLPEEKEKYPMLRISLSDVPESSHRFYATAVTSYIFFFSFLYMVWREYEWYISVAHRFDLGVTDAPRNYTVYVSGIPPLLRTDGRLRRYFQEVLGDIGGEVLEAHVALDVPWLEKATKAREAAARKVRWLKARIRLYGGEATEKGGNYEEVDGDIEGKGCFTKSNKQQTLPFANLSYSTRLERRLAEVRDWDEKIDQVLRRIDERKTLDDADESAIEADVRAVVKSGYSSNIQVIGGNPPDTVEENHVDHRDRELNGTDTKMPAQPEGWTGRVLHTVESQASGAVSSLFHTVKNTAHTVESAVKATAQTIEDEAGGAVTTVWTGVREATLGSDPARDGTARSSGFVSFSSLRVASVARQAVHHPSPFVLVAGRAPRPPLIFWKNVGLSHRSIQYGRLMGGIGAFFLCVLWTVPVALVSSLTKVESLKEIFPFLQNASPTLDGFLAQVAPMFLVGLTQLVIPILTKLSTWEGHVSGGSLEASVYSKHSAFQIIQTFFVSAVSGSIIYILGEIQHIAENPTAIVDLLATTLGDQAAFFLQYAIVKTIVGGTLELLRPVPLLLDLLRKLHCKMAGRKDLTLEDRTENLLGFLTPLESPMTFSHATMMSDTILLFVILFVYQSITPVAAPVLAICFALQTIIYRRVLVCVYDPSPDLGGVLWPSAVSTLVVVAILAQLATFGILSLKLAPTPAATLVFLPVVTILFGKWYFNQQHSRVASNLPTSTAAICEDSTDGVDVCALVSDKYVQPALTFLRRTKGVGINSDAEEDHENGH